jgi:hypothetical protein
VAHARQGFLEELPDVQLIVCNRDAKPLHQDQSGGGQAATKENLDLPFDAFANTEEEEEAPEVIFFHGQQYEGDGYTHCSGHDTAQYARQTLSQATAANRKRHSIDSVCVGTDQVDENWCKQLASLNGGTYKRVPR